MLTIKKEDKENWGERCEDHLEVGWWR